MLLYKQAEKGVQLQVEQSDWLADTDEEIDEQELEAHYSYMAKIQEVPNARIRPLTLQPLEQVPHYEGLVKEKTKVITDLKLKEEKDIDKMISMEHQLKFLNEIVYKRSQSIQTIHMLAPKCPSFNGRLPIVKSNVPLKDSKEHPVNACRFKVVESLEENSVKLESDMARICQLMRSMNYNAYIFIKSMDVTVLHKSLSETTDFVSKEIYTALLQRFARLEKHSISLELALQECQVQLKNDTVCKERASNVFRMNCEQYVENTRFESSTAGQEIAINVNARTKKPNVVPISTRKPKSQANKSVATPHKKTVASESTITNSKSYYRMLYKKTNKAWKWWIAQQCPSAYTWVPKTKRKWVPKVRNESVTKKIVQLILFIVDSGCTKHMTGNLSLLCNFVEKYLGTVRFGNDQFAPILGYGDLVQGNITIKRVYYVEGLNHNLFSVGQFCDADLEVAFRKSTCFVRDLQGNDLLTGNRGTDLYTISLQETTSSTPICLMAKASPTQAWLWHRRLSHLNFDYINLLSKKDVVIGLPKLKCVKDQLCSSCEVSKAKRSSFKSKTVPSTKGRLNLLQMDLCGPMRVASINGKRHILVIVDDYSRYTWTLFLRSKDETPEVLKDFLTMIQKNLQALVISVRTDRGTEFLNKTLNAFFKEEGIEHQTSTPRTPEQNGVVERRNRTLVEAARTMLSASKLPLFFWAEAIATTCYTQNRSIIIPTHEKTAYYIINDRKPSIKHLHIFGCTCYLTRDGKNLDKMKEKGDPFDEEIKEMSETSIANGTSGLVPQRQKASDYDNPDLAPELQNFLLQSNKQQFHHNRVQENVESSSSNIGTSNMHTFNQPQDSEYRWTQDHPLTQVRGNPSKPVQTRRQLGKPNPEMCMFALTMSIVEPENIKDAMADSAY
ncbi:retrovirus-related pol polyprotein from transposon TNT 1-94 [Tanacetum coccineum]